MGSSHDTPRLRQLRAVGLLVLRVGVGAFMIYAHGWSKLIGFSEASDSFADPFGLGSMPSLVLAIFAEVFCSALLVLGLFTRFAAIPLIATMSVAAFIVHADDPFGDRELALVYLVAYVALLLTGPGELSLDRVLLRKKR
jgi:putative oxidoreductase